MLSEVNLLFFSVSSPPQCTPTPVSCTCWLVSLLLLAWHCRKWTAQSEFVAPQSHNAINSNSNRDIQTEGEGENSANNRGNSHRLEPGVVFFTFILTPTLTLHFRIKFEFTFITLFLLLLVSFRTDFTPHSSILCVGITIYSTTISSQQIIHTNPLLYSSYTQLITIADHNRHIKA